MSDYIIIGAGLAGTMLAMELMGRGRRVTVIDNGARSSSMVAGGLMNPLTGKRLVHDESFPEKYARAIGAYADVPRALRTLPIVRVLTDDMEKNAWHRKEAGLRTSAGITTSSFTKAVGAVPMLNPDLEGAEVIVIPEAGHLDTAAVVASRKDRLREGDVLVTAQVNLRAWDPSSTSITGIEAGRIVFCDGWHLSSHDVFGCIPMMCAKGQLLTVLLPTHEEMAAMCIHHGRFLVPLGGHRYRYGATYEWNDVNDAVLDSTTDFLSAGLRTMISGAFSVVDAHAGVRPIVRDLTPVLGIHPEHPHLAVFNGMGSKGALLAPTLAPMLADHLEHGSPLPAAYSIDRFRRLHA
ncbi:MAG: NAD(P)/FAD-dependent oxidoreductase [Candidatus Kapaibacterium sp.]